MSSLSDKLKSLGVQVGTENTKLPIKHKAPSSLTEVLNGSWEETTSGDCFIVRNSFQAGHKHGRINLHPDIKPNILEGHPGLRGIASIPIERYLFIDTETTGLSGGTGTYVFLIGAAKFINNQIEFVQFFLEDPSIESAQLAAFDQFSSTAEVIISYNGKSFDLPRIKTRYRFHGWPTPFPDIYHIDLLHIVRKLWRDHLPSCTLGEIEYQLLGVERSSLDVPGWQISSLFFDYLQSGDAGPLRAVFYHNEEDVISLIALLIYIIKRLSSPLTPSQQPQNDLISIGIYLLQLKQFQSAFSVFSQALDSPDLSDSQKSVASYHLAQIHKTNQDYSIAASLWKESAVNSLITSPHIELAMYYEHKENDYPEAIHWTLSAIDLLSNDLQSNQAEKTLAELKHRLARLKRKMSNTSSSK